MKSQTVSVFINAPPARVYAYTSNPANLPAWAPSFFKSIAKVDGQWIAESPLGRAVFSFVETNPFGVLDHQVTVAPGLTFNNPMRVIANGNGSEVIFTLFQHFGMSDHAFAQDAAQVKGDLERLRRLMEEPLI